MSARTVPARAVLLVSDNPGLAGQAMAILRSDAMPPGLQVELRHTVLNREPEALMALGASVIDMKDERVVDEVLARFDLVISVHCKQIFPARLVEGVRCVNVHPGFNPYNRGWYPQAFSILNGLPAGATIHQMDAQVDHGPIIAQREVPVGPADTSLDVYRRVLAAEAELLQAHLPAIVSGRHEARTPAQEGNYNRLQDFRALCELRLDDTGTWRQHLDTLRATTHGEFRNAWFRGADGRRYVVRVSIEPEPDPA